MGFWKNIKNNYRKKNCAKMGLSLKSVHQIKKSSDFIYEQCISLSQINISHLLCPGITPPKIGYLTYFHSGIIGCFQSIGRYCSFGNDVIIGGEEHPTNWLSTHPFQYNSKTRGISVECKTCTQTKEPPIIGNDVWVGARVIVMRGVSIGDGAIIGAGSIVTKDVPAYAIVAGVPAKVIKLRFPIEIIERLKTLKWWNLDPTQLKKVKFNSIEEAVKDLEAITDRKEFKPETFLYTRKGITKL